MATAPVTVTANLNFNPASINAAGKQVQSAFGNINLPTKAVNNFNNSLGRITGQASEFDKSINAATARVFAFGAAVSIINGLSTAFKALVSSTIEVEKRLTEIGSILGGTTEQLGQFKNAIFDVAKNTGQTFSTVADAASELARQGLSAEETVKRLNASLILTRVSGLDAEGSVNALTSAINGFTSAGLTAEQIVNKLIAVDTAFAVSAKDLAEAFSRAGSTAEDAGVSFDELLGLVTSVQQTTARGGAVIGNAFKSIFSRLSRGTVIEDLKALGVQIDSSQTGVQKLQALSQALSNISDPTQANAIKELAGGVYQINVVSAALKDLSSETSIFARASQTAGQASNEAFEKNAQLNQTLAAQINKLVQGLTELGSKVGELTIAPVIENLLTGANKLLDILNKVFDPEEGNKLIQGFFKGIGAFIAGPGLVLVSAAFFKLFQVVAKFAKEGISDLFKIGSEQERIKNIEGGIVALLQQDANLRAILLSTSTTQAQKEQAVINAIKQQNALLTQQQALVNSIATAAAQAGVGGFSPSGGFTNKGGKKRFAAGFKEEEAMAKSLGASSSVKAKMGQGTIGGQKFIMNNQEVEIPNFGGGRDSAVIPLYARGFIPNYAKTRNTLEDYPDAELSAFLKEASQKNESKILIGNTKIAFTKGQIEQAIKNKSALKAKKQRQDKRITGTAEKRLSIDGSPYGFLVPPLGANKRQFTEQINEQLKIDKGKNTGVNFNLTALDVRGPLFPTKELEGAKSRKLDIADKIKREVIKASVSYSRPITSTLGNKKVEKSDIEDLFVPSVKEGGRQGAYGALQGVIGSAFEAAVVAAVGGNKAAPDGPDFDVDAPNSDIDKIFFGGQGKKKKYDFKVSNSEDSVKSFASKIINDNGKYQTELTDFFARKEKNKKAKSAASGFIPNFNSLNKGIPVNKIRAHFDGMGNPVAVTNTRDEPNGLKDAIGRERKGIGMAAGGFIPNYALGGVGGFLQASPAEASKQVAEAAKKAAEAAKKAAEGLDDIGKKGAEASSKFQRMSGAITALSTAYYFVGIPAIESLSRAFALDEEALKKETDARDKAVKALAEQKKKGDKANADVVKKLEEEVTARNDAITKMNEAADEFASKASDISNIVANAGFILSLIPFGKIKEGLASLVSGRAAQFVARPLAGAGAAAAGGGGATVSSIVAGGVTAIAGAFAAALATFVASAGAGFGIYKAIEALLAPFESLPEQIKGIQTSREALEKITIPDLDNDAFRYRNALRLVASSFKEGYEIIKITATGIRSEFEKLNDEVGFSGFNSRISQSESADRLASGAKDIVAEQNLRKTRDPFEKQNIIKRRERDRISETFSAGERERASAAQVLKTGQEDFLTGISKFINTKTPSLEELNNQIDIKRGNKDGEIKPITDKVFSTPASSLDFEKNMADSLGFTNDLKSILSADQQKSQTKLFDALTRRTDALESLKNSTEKNQGANLKELLNAENALKPLLQERAKQQGGEEGVGALNEELQKNADSIKSFVEAQTQSFIKENEQREKINLDSLQKQKGVFDQFIDNFNATFSQNAERAGVLIGEAFASGKDNTINENIQNLGKGNLATGMATGDTFLKRQEAFNQTISKLETSGLFESVGTAEQQAGFRSQIAGEILGGGNVTALQNALGLQSGTLQKNVTSQSISNNEQARATIGGAAVTAFEPILKQIREAASKAGDTALTQDIDRRLATLNDPRAKIGEITNAGNINLEGTKLSEADQTGFQTALIGATGGVQKFADLFAGIPAQIKSESLGTAIEGVAAKLTTLQKALQVTVDDVGLSTVIKEFTTSTEGITPIVDAFKSKIADLEKASSERVELIKKYNESEAALVKIHEEYTTKMESNLGRLDLMFNYLDLTAKKAEALANAFPSPPDPLANPLPQF
jgi:TP901 family phage tail tape measure protein